MFSKIFLSKENLIHNVEYLKKTCSKPICVMIKANAYGHGVKQVIEMLDDHVDYLGVSNQREGEEARAETDKHIVVFGRCEEYIECMKRNISFALFSFEDAKKITRLAKENDVFPRFHLCVNSGMNRYGIKEKSELEKTINFLDKNNIHLEGIYTHFSSLASDNNYTLHQKEIFEDYVSLIPSHWQTIKHIGGGRSVFSGIKADMYRVGLECYGYGDEKVKSVLRIESQIVDIQKVYKGEHVGYLCGFTAENDMCVATIPLGYGDGLPRKLSNRLEVDINGKKTRVRGNVCMDAFMCDVSDIDCEIGDRVEVFDNASAIAPIIESTEYEVLTNLAKFRGERVIE